MADVHTTAIITDLDDQGVHLQTTEDGVQGNSILSWDRLRELGGSKDVIWSRVYTPILDEAEAFFKRKYGRNAPVYARVIEIGSDGDNVFHVVLEA
jgi:hypothetical protein